MFGLVGVIIAAMAGVGIVTNGRLSTQAETVYIDYTVPLTEFNQLLFNVNRYHESLVDVARTPRARLRNRVEGHRALPRGNRTADQQL